jgi:hypothetical protein
MSYITTQNQASGIGLLGKTPGVYLGIKSVSQEVVLIDNNSLHQRDSTASLIVVYRFLNISLGV